MDSSSPSLPSFHMKYVCMFYMSRITSRDHGMGARCKIYMGEMVRGDIGGDLWVVECSWGTMNPRCDPDMHVLDLGVMAWGRDVKHRWRDGAWRHWWWLVIGYWGVGPWGVSMPHGVVCTWGTLEWLYYYTYMYILLTITNYIYIWRHSPSPHLCLSYLPFHHSL